ncbi:MAG: hypothetical protein ABJF69_02680, partial [Anderseniella sp.]
MIRRLFVVSAAALMLMAGSQGASAAANAPGTAAKTPIAAHSADGSYKVAKKARNRNRRNRRKRNRRRNMGIGLGLAAGA